MSAALEPTPEPTARLRLHREPALRPGNEWIALERKAAAALAWLALSGPTPRRRLADLLWPTASDEAARNSLRQLLFKLRKAAGTPPIEGDETLRLAVDWQPAQADGELLAGWRYDDCPAFDEWLQTTRAEQGRRHEQAELQRIDRALEAGDADTADQAIADLLARDPLSEPVRQRQIQALYLAGRLAEAVATGREVLALWSERLGSEPSTELARLMHTVEQAAAQAQPARPPVSVLRPPRMVGRQHELALAADAWATARVALVVGEPGLGKSRLLAEHVAVTAGAHLAGCRPGDGTIPYGALARWLRSLRAACPSAFDPLPRALGPVLPELDTAVSGSAGGDVAAGWIDLLTRASRDGLAGVALDDLHFADEASLEALTAAVDADALAALRWTLGRRPAEGAPALDGLADHLLDEHLLVPVNLAPLDEAGVRELLASLGIPGLGGDELAGELFRATGGNPMFALETLKALILHPGGPSARRLPRPASVAALIDRRLRQLSPTALSLARVAALAGPDFDASLAGHVMQVPVLSLADAWQELETAQVLKEQAFAHDLIYEATLASVPGPVQRHTRRAIAEHLAQRHGEPARIAEHWTAAGEPAQAAPHYMAAGRRAEAAARYGEARQLMEQAARCHASADQPMAALETRLALADILMEAGDLAAAHQVLDDAGRQSLDADGQVRVAMQRMHVLVREDEGARAVALAESLLADPVMQDEAPPLRMAQLRWTLAMCIRTTGGAEAALAQLSLAEPLLANTPDPTWRCWFHSQKAVALQMMARLEEAWQSQDQAVSAAREVGRHRMLAGCLQNGAGMATAAGRLVETVGMLDECLSLMADSGGDLFTRHVQIQRARVLVWLGRYREAIAVLEPLADPAAEMQAFNRGRVWVTLAELWTHLGQPHRAEPLLAKVASLTPDPFERQVLAVVQEEIAWLAGQRSGSATTDPGTEGWPMTSQLAMSMLQGWRRHLPPEGRGTAEAADAWRASGLHGHALMADVLAAGQASRLGDHDGAVERVERSLAALRRVGPPGIYRPWLYLALGEAAGDAAPPWRRRALQEGAEWIRNVARYQVPPAYQASFTGANRINRELLAQAAAAG